jgi:hypothetical protein
MKLRKGSSSEVNMPGIGFTSIACGRNDRIFILGWSDPSAFHPEKQKIFPVCPVDPVNPVRFFSVYSVHRASFGERE